MSAVFVFLTYLLSIFALVYYRQPRLFKLHRWGVAASSLSTACVGLYAWIQTLSMRTSLGLAWNAETPAVRSLVQRRVSVVDIPVTLFLSQACSLTAAVTMIL